jgi:hypothetical protein
MPILNMIWIRIILLLMRFDSLPFQICSYHVLFLFDNLWLFCCCILFSIFGMFEIMFQFSMLAYSDLDFSNYVELFIRFESCGK